MHRSFKIQNLGCANCAAKMENDINKLDGVSKASISFMTQRLTLDADDTRFDDIVNECDRICKKYEPETSIAR
mgnify:FL=1